MFETEKSLCKSVCSLASGVKNMLNDIVAGWAQTSSSQKMENVAAGSHKHFWEFLIVPQSCEINFALVTLTLLILV